MTGRAVKLRELPGWAEAAEEMMDSFPVYRRDPAAVALAGEVVLPFVPSVEASTVLFVAQMVRSVEPTAHYQFRQRGLRVVQGGPRG